MASRPSGVMFVACFAGATGAGAQDADPLVVGGDYDYPPYEWLDERGQANGFHVDLLRELADELGREVEFRLLPWAEAYAELQAGKVDVLPMFYSESRAQDFLFTETYQVLPHEIFMAEGGTAIRRFEDLRGATVAVQQQSLAASFLTAQDLGAAIVPVTTEARALERVAAGEAQYAVVTQVGAQATRQSPTSQPLASTGPLLIDGRYGLAVLTDQSRLRDELDDALTVVRADGRFRRLQDRWLAIGPVRDAPPALPPVAWIGAALAALLLAGTWHVTLNARVATATRGLHEELAKRTREDEARERHAEALRASKDELERFNRLAVGRELRMVDLKREVNELSRELGRPDRHALPAESAEDAS